MRHALTNEYPKGKCVYLKTQRRWKEGRTQPHSWLRRVVESNLKDEYYAKLRRKKNSKR